VVLVRSALHMFLCACPQQGQGLGLELVEPLQDQPHLTRRPPMGEEKRDDGVGDPFKLLLENPSCDRGTI